ncbi:MAG: NAD-dependent epimerase/dehydratase family protein [Novosphingobium sp.]
MKNVIVTGASGFIGQTLVAELRARFPEANIVPVSSKVVDLADEHALFAWLDGQRKQYEADHIFHLAALYKAGDWPVHHPATQFNVNLKINTNVLEGWNRYFPKSKFTSILSYCMYPSTENAHPESELWGHEPEDYLFAYAMTKKALLIGQRAYRQEYGGNCASVVLPTVYGPHDSFAENSHVVGALIGKFVRAQRSGAPTVEVWGDGKQEREFLYVNDAADGIIGAALGTDVDVINLGMGRAESIGQIANWIKEAAGFEGEIVYNENRFVGVKTRWLDVTRARETIGWTAATPLRDGLKKTVDWYAATLDAEAAGG